jgi:hypothetical protein
MEANGVLSVVDVDGALLGRLDSGAALMSNGDLSFSVFGSNLNQIGANDYRATFRTTESDTVILVDLGKLDDQ